MNNFLAAKKNVQVSAKGRKICVNKFWNPSIVRRISINKFHFSGLFLINVGVIISIALQTINFYPYLERDIFYPFFF